MKKRKTYSKKLNLNDYFDMNMTDVWDGIKELQRATKAVAIIALVAVLIDPLTLRKSCMKFFYKLKKLI